MLSTEGGLCGVLWGKVAELQGVLSHLPTVPSHPEGSGGLWPWSGRSSLFFHACEPVYMETQC